MIDLSKSRKGDRYEARDGEVWTYVRPTPNSRLCHDLTDQNGEVYGFCAYGAFWQAGLESGHDLLRALDPESREEPAPEAGADDLVERFDRAAQALGWLYDQGAMKPLRGKAEGELDRAVQEHSAAKAALHTRIEALTQALEEAGKVIAPFAARCEEIDGVKIVAKFAREGSAQVDLTLLRAARDWRRKHGGKADA